MEEGEGPPGPVRIGEAARGLKALRERFWRWVFVLAVRRGRIPLEKIGEHVLSTYMAEIAEEQPWIIQMLAPRVYFQRGERRLPAERRERRSRRIP